MTFYEMSQPTASKFSLFDGIFSRMSAGVQAVQYGRMLQALSALSDAQLDAIDVKRADIPAHAHRCIYGA